MDSKVSTLHPLLSNPSTAANLPTNQQGGAGVQYTESSEAASHGNHQIATALTGLVDPYLELMLDLLDQIEREETLAAETVHNTLKGYLRQAGLAAGKRDTWQRILYALVSWSDEVLLNSPWEGASWWNDHLLEVEFFNTRIAGQQFYRHAQDAADHHDMASLRTYYICVLLGFRGVYAQRNPLALERLRLPSTLSHWMSNLRDLLTINPLETVPVSIARKIPGAHPVDLRKQIVWWSIALLGLLVTNLTVMRLSQ